MDRQKAWPEDAATKIQPINCDMYRRPDIFVSEVSQSVKTNMPVLSAQQKDEANDTANPDHYRSVLRKVAGDKKTTKIMVELFNISSKLFNLSTNYLGAKELLNNPESIAQVIQRIWVNI